MTIVIALAQATTNAADFTIQAGATSQTIYVTLGNPDTATSADIGGFPGIAYNDSNIKAYYIRPGGSLTAITLVTQTVTGTYSSGGWVELSATNAPGRYRLDIPNLAIAAGVARARIMVSYDSGDIHLLDDIDIDLLGYDPTAAALAANVTQFGGSNGTFSSGRPAVNTTYLAGSVLSEDEVGVMAGTFSSFFGAYNGVQNVDIRNITNIYTKVDTEVAAIKTKTDFLPSATAGSTGGLFIAGTNAATSITSGLTANITGNLSGSVGSVTGNVGGNVVGSIGSISGITFPANFSGLTITSGRVNADVTHWLGTAPTSNVPGVPKVDVTHVFGTEVCH